MDLLKEDSRGKEQENISVEVFRSDFILLMVLSVSLTHYSQWCRASLFCLGRGIIFNSDLSSTSVSPDLNFN